MSKAYDIKLRLINKPIKHNWCPWCGTFLNEERKCPNRWCVYIIEDILWKMYEEK